MAINISNTAHYKKGEKLPDGSIAKRGVVINKTTGKRVTGKVTMTAAGQGGMGATKSYKAGRSVSAMKRTASKKNGAGKTNSGGSDSSKPTPPTDAKKARDARLQANKGVKGGTIRAGAAGRGVRKYNAKTGRWERVSGVSGASTISSQSKTPKSSTATAMDKWKSLSPAQKTAARKNATQFARMMGISPSKAVLGSLGIQLSPGAAPRNPLSVRGQLERGGAAIGMSISEANKIMAAYQSGNRRIGKALFETAKKVIEGR